MVIDEDWEFELIIWVATKKSSAEFYDSLKKIIFPLQIANDKFSLGGINATIDMVEKQPVKFHGVPAQEYAFKLVIPTTTTLFWGAFDKRVVYALATGMRLEFNCSYLVTTDSSDFVWYSGTNEGHYINENFPSCTNGELIPNLVDLKKVVKLRL